jgi:GTP-binding protein HflX
LHVVDASDDSKNDHKKTTEDVLTELDLDAIPRVLVFNKVDHLAPLEQKVLQKRHPDAVLLSALERESTRPLLTRLANELKERWDESAKTPEIAVEDTASIEPDERDNVVEASTLDDLLRAAGRRVKRAVGRPPEPRTARSEKLH